MVSRDDLYFYNKKRYYGLNGKVSFFCYYILENKESLCRYCVNK